MFCVWKKMINKMINEPKDQMSLSVLRNDEQSKPDFQRIKMLKGSITQDMPIMMHWKRYQGKI